MCVPYHIYFIYTSTDPINYNIHNLINSFPLYMRLGLGALDGRSVWKPDPPLALPEMVLLRQAVDVMIIVYI